MRHGSSRSSSGSAAYNSSPRGRFIASIHSLRRLHASATRQRAATTDSRTVGRVAIGGPQGSSHSAQRAERPTVRCCSVERARSLTGRPEQLAASGSSVRRAGPCWTCRRRTRSKQAAPTGASDRTAGCSSSVAAVSRSAGQASASAPRRPRSSALAQAATDSRATRTRTSGLGCSM